jgi:hypothetical protein
MALFQKSLWSAQGQGQPLPKRNETNIAFRSDSSTIECHNVTFGVAGGWQEETEREETKTLPRRVCDLLMIGKREVGM